MDLNSLKQQMMDKLGLDEAGSDEAIEMVLGFVKDKLPENMQGLVDGISKGEMPDVGGAMDAVKGFFK